jgi:hypothetical protein
MGLVCLMLLPPPVRAVGPGDLETRFGDTGTVQTDVGGRRRDTVAALALQVDGTIIAARRQCDGG